LSYIKTSGMKVYSSHPQLYARKIFWHWKSKYQMRQYYQRGKA